MSLTTSNINDELKTIDVFIYNILGSKLYLKYNLGVVSELQCRGVEILIVVATYKFTDQSRINWILIVKYIGCYDQMDKKI